MINYTSIIKAIIEAYPENEIIVSSDLHSEKLKEVPETIYYKTLQRMSDSGELLHLTKGIYSKPKKTKYGLVGISENEILSFYTKSNRGLSIGYDLYNKKGITTQTPNSYKVLSNILNEERKTIKNVNVNKINFDLNIPRIEAIEIFEILQNYESIEDGNPRILAKIMEEYVKHYNEKETFFVLDNIKYKKSTIASLQDFLNYFHIENNLDIYLSSLSTYKKIEARRFYETPY